MFSALSHGMTRGRGGCSDADRAWGTREVHERARAREGEEER